MDIFTTQLVNVQPQRILPEKLKVKALLKKSKISPLSDQTKEIDEQPSKQQHSSHQASNQDEEKRDNQNDTVESESSSSSGKHLDIYV
jgi:hypothetical protein